MVDIIFISSSTPTHINFIKLELEIIKPFFVKNHWI